MHQVKKTALTFLVITSILMPGVVVMAAMSSTNYSIQSDSINFAGGLSTSTNYALEGTAGEVGSGDSSSENYNLHAGYQQMQTNYISISVTGNASLGSINGVSGGTLNGSSTINVITDSPSGYSLIVKASTSPALVSSIGSKIPDYAPAATSSPDFNFSVNSSNSAFGFTPEGQDIIPFYKDNGSLCNWGTGDTTDKCWDGFSTTPKTIAQSSVRTSTTGTQTVLKYRVQIGSNALQESGMYSAPVTITAVTL